MKFVFQFDPKELSANSRGKEIKELLSESSVITQVGQNFFILSCFKAKIEPIIHWTIKRSHCYYSVCSLNWKKNIMQMIKYIINCWLLFKKKVNNKNNMENYLQKFSLLEYTSVVKHLTAENFLSAYRTKEMFSFEDK